jgi:hypothetical protein
MQGLLLGLANGSLCITYCAPVLIPYMLGEGKTVRQNACVLGQFLAGRLVGCLCFALLAWVTSLIILHNMAYRNVIFGVVYIGLALLLFIYSVSKPRKICAVNSSKPFLEHVAAKWPTLLPVGLGLLTGLNICPPFLLIFTEAVNAESLMKSLFFFFMFFLGTSVYFLPIPLLGVLRSFPQVKTVGKMTAAIIALYYLYVGLTMIGGV